MNRRRVVMIVAAFMMTAVSGLVLADQAARSSTPASRAGAWRTPWGEPDLQGIWNGSTLTPLERPARFAGKPVLTPEEAAALEAAVHARPGRDDRSQRGTERDVAGAYNQLWTAVAETLADRRTSLILDPADGRIPAMTPEAARRAEQEREYLRALLDGTASGRPGSQVSPRRAEAPPRYNIERMNRSDGPEDRSSTERCLGNSMPSYGGFYRIVQSPRQVGIYVDAGQGQGFLRTIPVDGSAHPPAALRFLHGDSRGHWEGDTLVVSVANFTQKMDFRGARENLRLTERFTRAGADRIDYRVTIEDPTTWTRPWTLGVPWNKQPERANQVYESTCHEGNYGLLGMLTNTRAAERLFAEGKGPDPATQDNATGGGDNGGGIER